MPKDMGLICRTASVNATPEMLIEEATELLKTWQNIVENFHKANKPTCLYEESDLIKRAVLTAVDKKFDRLLVDDYATYQRCKRLYAKYSSEHPLKIELYRDKARCSNGLMSNGRSIGLCGVRSGFPAADIYFSIEQKRCTPSMSTLAGAPQSSTGDVEEALVRINMEAAEEIARQLRIRNVGGLVICDFIDMRSRKNQRRVLDRLKEAMKDDSAKCTILGMSEFGLVEMTRQRSRESLTQTIFTNCPYCNGSGMIKSHESISVEIERAVKKLISQQQQFGLELISHPDLDHYLGHQDKEHLRKLAEKMNAELCFDNNDNLHLNEFQFYSTINGKKLEI